MKARFALIFSLVFTLGMFAAFIADDDPIKAILTKLEKFRAEYPQEKVYVHMDKPFYAIGDNIWLKAYVVEAETHQLSAISKTVYVELINERDSVKQTIKLPLTAGIGWGDFQLTDSLSEGNYRIRAYTNYMRNFGEEYFFDKTISIGNAISNSIVTTVDYKFSKEGSIQNVEATVNYSDLDGRVLSGKDVNYNVQLDFRSVAKGKATTDAKGNIVIRFTNTQPFILKSGKINTVVKLDEQRSYTKAFPIKTTSNEVDVQFFPEGGQLVNKIRSRIAFKAVGSDGLGTAISGYIKSSSGERVAEFKTEHAGMGFFALMPLPGESYTAVVTYADGSEKSLPLPQAASEGFVLSAGNMNKDNLVVKISASEGYVAKGGEMTLVAQSNSSVKFVSKNKLDNPVFSANIPKNRFPTGILQLTLFDTQNRPVSERLVFINHNDDLKFSATGPEISKTREKVKMDLDVKNAEGKPVVGSFSVSVTDASKVMPDKDNESTIISNLLLTSDIKGYVEQPNYYFHDITDDKVRQLDNLMLTQGWRRFTWKNILADNYPAKTFKPEDGIVISGKVTKGGKPVENGKVMLLSSSGSLFVIDTVTDAQGRFEFESLIFPDSTRFVVQARNAKDRKFVEIELDRLPPPLVTKNLNSAEVEVNVNKSLSSYLKNSRDQFEELRRYGMLDKNIMLSEVKIVERKDNKVEGSSNLAGFADATLRADQLGPGCIDLSQCLQGRVAGLIVQGGVAYLTRSMYSSLSGPVPMQLIVDGVYVEPDFLSMINPQDVEAIEVLKSASTTAIYGMRGGGGVLIITTKRGEGVKSYNNYAPGVVTYAPKGFYNAKQFYSPNYDDPKTKTEAPDLRTTVYWNPYLLTKEGKTSFEFFNADGKGPYRVVVEGIDVNGNLGHYEFTYIVK